MPLFGTLDGVNLADNTTYWQNRSLNTETSTVGLFTTTLLNGVKIEITSSNHSGYIRYTYPGQAETLNNNSSIAGHNDVPEVGPTSQSQSDAHILVDLTHVLPGYSTQAYSQRYLHGDLHIRSNSSSPSYFGSATYTGAWSQPETHTLYFCGNFSSSALAPSSAYVTPSAGSYVPGAGTFSWAYNPVLPPAFNASPALEAYTDVRAYTGSGMGLGALFSWSPASQNLSAPLVLEAKLGISYISSSQACSSVQNELPSNLIFDDIVQQARTEWEEKILSKIEVVNDGSESASNVTLKRMLYSALYQTGLMPTDKTGENPRWASNDSYPYYDDHYVSSAS